MTQFKDKSAKQGADAASVGLFTYPILMAADILLYDAEIVPVGEDQRQHLELTRDLAHRFNSRFGETFAVPEPYILEGDRQDLRPAEPDVEDVEVGESHAGIIWVLDEPKVTAKKIMRAVTDTDGVVAFDREAKPGVSNLLTIYSVLADRSIESLEAEYAGRGYGDLKKVPSATAPSPDCRSCSCRGTTGGTGCRPPTSITAPISMC